MLHLSYINNCLPIGWSLSIFNSLLSHNVAALQNDCTWGQGKKEYFGNVTKVLNLSIYYIYTICIALTYLSRLHITCIPEETTYAATVEFGVCQPQVILLRYQQWTQTAWGACHPVSSAISFHCTFPRRTHTHSPIQARSHLHNIWLSIWHLILSTTLRRSLFLFLSL